MLNFIKIIFSCLLAMTLAGCEQERVPNIEEFLLLQNEQMENPEAFGKQIIADQMAYAALIVQSPLDPKVNALRDRIKLMLLVVGSHGPE